MFTRRLLERIEWFLNVFTEPNARLDWINIQGIIRPTIIKHPATGLFLIQLTHRTHRVEIISKNLLKALPEHHQFLKALKIDPTVSVLDIDVGDSSSDGVEFCYWFCSRYRDNPLFALPRSSNFFFKELPEKLLHIIDGALAGDGCIVLNSAVAGVFRLILGSKQRGHLEDFVEELRKFGFSGQIRDNSRFDKHQGKVINSTEINWCLWVFKKHRERWYPNGVKTLPNDVPNTPDFWRWFYAGDGCLVNNSANSAAILLAANDFSTEDVDRLIAMLSVHGVVAKRFLKRITESTGKPQWVITFYTKSVINFLTMIGGPVKSIEYKWRFLNYPLIPCKHCDMEFYQTRMDREYCSNKCAAQHNHILRRNNTPSLKKRKASWNKLRSV